MIIFPHYNDSLRCRYQYVKSQNYAVMYEFLNHKLLAVYANLTPPHMLFI